MVLLTVAKSVNQNTNVSWTNHLCCCCSYPLASGTAECSWVGFKTSKHVGQNWGKVSHLDLKTWPDRVFNTAEQALGLNVGNDLLTQFLHSGLFLNNNLIISNFFTNHYIPETSWADEAKQMKMLDNCLNWYIQLIRLNIMGYLVFQNNYILLYISLAVC